MLAGRPAMNCPAVTLAGALRRERTPRFLLLGAFLAPGIALLASDPFVYSPWVHQNPVTGCIWMLERTESF
jgi:hypothetical protein